MMLNTNIHCQSLVRQVEHYALNLFLAQTKARRPHQYQARVVDQVYSTLNHRVGPFQRHPLFPFSQVELVNIDLRTL